jgi:hypothetical protein
VIMTNRPAAAHGILRAGLGAFILSGLLAAGCDQDITWVRDLENGDYSLVQFARAPGGLQPVVPSGELERYVARACEYLAGRQPLLNTIAGLCPCIEPSPLDNFRFAGVLADAEGGTMLQFYAPYGEPRLFAGRRVEFVMDASYRLEAVYVNDVPLEQ